MAYAGGERTKPKPPVDHLGESTIAVPVDLGEAKVKVVVGPQKIEWTPKEMAQMRREANEQASRYEKSPPKCLWGDDMLDRMTAKGAERFGNIAPRMREAGEPTTAGPKAPKAYKVVFRIEVIDKEGRVVLYDTITPRDKVMAYDSEISLAKGRTHASYQRWHAEESNRLDVDMSVRDRFLVFQHEKATKTRYPDNTVRVSVFEMKK